MKYFKPIQSGVNKGMTFFEYLINNTLPYIIGVIIFACYFFIKPDPIAKEVGFIFLLFSLFAFIATVVDWGIKRKRWED